MSLNYLSKRRCGVTDGQPARFRQRSGPCDVPLESLRIREECRPRALTHLVGKDLFVARDDACDDRPRGVRRRGLLEREHLAHLGVNRPGIHAKYLRVLSNY